jgi:hypothetical protein
VAGSGRAVGAPGGSTATPAGQVGPIGQQPAIPTSSTVQAGTAGAQTPSGQPGDTGTGDTGTGGTGAGTAVAAQPTENTSRLKPGYRLSYQLGAVSSAADRSTWQEDPNGTYVDPTTGKRYSSDRMAAPASQAAQGVRQLDVVSTDASGVVVAVDDILYDGGTNTFSPIPNPKVGPVQGKPGDVWIPPATLARFAGSGSGTGDQVLTGPYTFNNQQVTAVVLVNNDPNSYYFFAYDQATGILLRGDTSLVYEGTSSPTTPNTTNTRTSLELKGMRQREFPGSGAAWPSWAGQGTTLNYAGQYSLVDPSTGQPMSGSGVGLQEQVSITAGGTTWGTYQRTRQTQGASGSESSSGYVTTTSTYLMDPNSLAAMQSGAVLDTDPVTGEKWTVQQSGNGQVVLSREMPGYQWLGAYDIGTGRLLQAQVTTSLGVTQVQLQG